MCKMEQQQMLIKYRGIKLNRLSIHTSVSMVARQVISKAVVLVQAVQVAIMQMQEHVACVHPLA